jgi:hypothetical protein
MAIATLGIKVENGQIKEAVSSLDKLTTTSDKTERANARLSRRMGLMQIEAHRMNAAIDEAARQKTLYARATNAAATALRAFGLVAAAGVALAIRKTINETMEAQRTMALMENAVKATGGAAGRTVDQLDDMATALQKVSTYGDEAIKGAMTRLLSYTSIQGQTFDRATRAVLDFATAYRVDLVQAAETVGKALEYPDKATAALSRQGFRFTEAQQAQIKAMLEAGQVAEAQAIILGSLEEATLGAARAARDTLGGALAGLRNAWGDLFEVSVRSSQGTVDAINKITSALERSDISMDSILTSWMVLWEQITAAVRKFHNVMSIDLSKNIRQQWQEMKRLNDEIDRARDAAITRMIQPGRRGGPGVVAAGHDRQVVEDAKRTAKAAADEATRQSEEAQRLLDALMKRRMEEAIAAGRRMINDLTATLADRVRDGILGGMQKSLGPLGGMATSVIGAYVRQFMVLRAGQDIRSAMSLDDIADASKSLGPSRLHRVGGAALAGYGLGRASGSGMGGTLMGGMAGYALAGPLGAAAGAISGLISGLNGSAEAAKRFRMELQAYQRTMEQMEAAVRGDTMAEAVSRIKADADAQREAVRSLYYNSRAFSNPGAYGREMERINALEAERLRVLKAQAAEIARHAIEDLRVRDLASQGRTKEAEALRLQLQQQREYEEAMKAGRNEEYLDLLRRVHAQEALRRSSDALNRSMLNLPPLFKLAAMVFGNMDPLNRPAPNGSPQMPQRPERVPAGFVSDQTPVVLSIDGNVLMRSTVRQLQRKAANQFGDSTRWAEVTVQ